MYTPFNQSGLDIQKAFVKLDQINDYSIALKARKYLEDNPPIGLDGTKLYIVTTVSDPKGDYDMRFHFKCGASLSLDLKTSLKGIDGNDKQPFVIRVESYIPGQNEFERPIEAAMKFKDMKLEMRRSIRNMMDNYQTDKVKYAQLKLLHKASEDVKDMEGLRTLQRCMLGAMIEEKDPVKNKAFCVLLQPVQTNLLSEDQYQKTYGSLKDNLKNEPTWKGDDNLRIVQGDKFNVAVKDTLEKRIDPEIYKQMQVINEDALQRAKVNEKSIFTGGSKGGSGSVGSSGSGSVGGSVGDV